MPVHDHFITLKHIPTNSGTFTVQDEETQLAIVKAALKGGDNPDELMHTM